MGEGRTGMIHLSVALSCLRACLHNADSHHLTNHHKPQQPTNEQMESTTRMTPLIQPQRKYNI